MPQPHSAKGGSERRRAPRAAFTPWVEFLVLGLNDRAVAHWRVPAKDVSANGISVMLATPLPVSTRLIISLSAAGKDASLVRHALVRRAVAAGRGWTQIGAEFVPAEGPWAGMDWHGCMAKYNAQQDQQGRGGASAAA
jgi:hypothetical protein